MAEFGGALVDGDCEVGAAQGTRCGASTADETVDNTNDASHDQPTGQVAGAAEETTPNCFGSVVGSSSSLRVGIRPARKVIASAPEAWLAAVYAVPTAWGLAVAVGPAVRCSSQQDPRSSISDRAARVHHSTLAYDCFRAEPAIAGAIPMAT
jgi:hypothetical protein